MNLSQNKSRKKNFGETTFIELIWSNNPLIWKTWNLLKLQMVSNLLPKKQSKKVTMMRMWIICQGINFIWNFPRFFKKKCYNNLLWNYLFYFISSQDHDDDEFVSDSYRASSADIDEVNASMKTLGVKGNFSKKYYSSQNSVTNVYCIYYFFWIHNI